MTEPTDSADGRVSLPRAPTSKAPFLVRLSWIAPAVAIAGNIATLSTEHDASPMEVRLRFLVSLVWVLCLLVGFVAGLGSIVAAVVKRQPRWALHGAVGVVIPSALTALAVLAFSRGH